AVAGALELTRPYLHIDLDVHPPQTAAEVLRTWILQHQIGALHVGGPRHSEDSRVYREVLATLSLLAPMSPWQPVHEPFRITLMRTGLIALALAALLAARFGGLHSWPILTLLLLWPSLGGHFVELWFLNWLRPRIPRMRAVQVGARVGIWF